MLLRFAALLLPACGFAAAANPWSLAAGSSPQVRFASSEIRAACAARGERLAEFPLERAPSSGLRLIIAAGDGESARAAKSIGVAAPSSGRAAQSYAIRRSGDAVAVFGADAAGAMYGGLDLAEAIRLGTVASLVDADRSPHIARRGIKFNVPLDVRTPSYSDNSDQAQNNIPEMWSFDFWREFLDDMARHRFNTLSLWSLHPFPSLVKVPEFPDVALDDVLRTKVPMDDTYSHSGSDMFRPELMTRVEVVRRMTIQDKIRFWRDVMQYAHDRGIEVYWFTWNLFTFGAEGKHGITAAQDNPRTVEYFRASVREMVLTYPLLAGFGITAGERMQPKLTGEFSNEKWLWKTYGEGVADALKQQPGRQVRMIHRYHMTNHDQILREWKDYPGPLDLSFKYSIAHMYSIPNPPFLTPALPHLSPKLRTWLTVRDDDYYSFRWGDPAYAREFIRNIPGPDKVAGYYMGPDGTIWGRDFLPRDEGSRELVIRKRWYGFMIWGRLTYDPSLPDDLFQKTLSVRFPKVEPDRLSRAWSAASRVFPTITRFFWGDIDVRWQPEACISHPRRRGFYTVEDFMRGGTMPGSGLLNIVEWRRRKLAGQPAEPGPIEIADSLAADAGQALKLASDMRRGAEGELRSTLEDILAMGHLGNYYAEKIRGAAELALFDKTRAPERREAAVAHLRSALDHWKRYATAYTLQYRQPVLYNRVGWVDIPGLAAKAEQDIAIALLWTPGTIPDAPEKRSADTPFRKK